MKKFLLVIAACLLTGTLFGQQLNINSLYNLNRYEINPAVAGSMDGLPLALSYRKAWVGIDGSPSMQLLSGHMEVYDRMGVGLRVFNSTQGPLRRTGMEATYAYHIPLNDGGSKISLGLSGFLYQYYLKKGDLIVEDPSDPVMLGNESKTLPDAAFGAYYYGSNYFVGLSVYQLFGGRVRLNANDIAENRRVRHYFLIMGYNFEISEDFALEPSVLLKYLETGAFQADINLYATYMKTVSLGLSYRSGNAIVIQLGYKNDHLNVGYAYDLTLSDIKTVSSGSHEIMFIYRFDNFLKKVSE